MERERKLKRAKEREKPRGDWGRGRGNACEVSKIIVVTPLVVIMKDQVEQLQSIGIRALAIEVDEEEAGEMDRLDYL